MEKAECHFFDFGEVGFNFFVDRIHVRIGSNFRKQLFVEHSVLIDEHSFFHVVIFLQFENFVGIFAFNSQFLGEFARMRYQRK